MGIESLPKVSGTECSVTYCQEADSCSDDGTHYLRLFTQDAGGGNYYVLETERWAFDSSQLETLLAIIKDFDRRVKAMEKDENSESTP